MADELVEQFLPLLAADRFRLDGEGYVHLISADIIGFSTLSQAIEASTDDAAEKLTNILRYIFSCIAKLARENEGQILSFGGDSVLIGFTAPESPSVEDRARILQMCSMIDRICSQASLAQQFELRMRISAAHGSAKWVALDKQKGGIDCVLWGDALLKIYADDFEVNAMDAIAPAYLAKQMGCNFLEYGDVVATQSRHTGAHSLSDSRRVATIAFVRFGSHYLHQHSSQSTLHQISQKLNWCAKDFGAMVCRIRSDDKGLNALVVWGVQAHSYEDDAYRAVGFTCQIEQEFSDLRVGITSGRVFAGVVGDSQAYEFTVMGLCVNDAADLASRASQGRFLMDALTQQRLPHHQLAINPIELKLKGQSHSQVFYQAKKFQNNLEYRAPNSLSFSPLKVEYSAVTGRDKDVVAILEYLNHVHSVLISSEAGAGKSYLALEIVRRWEREGGQCLHIGFFADPNQIGWRPLLDTMAAWANKLALETGLLHEEIWRNFAKNYLSLTEREIAVVIQVIHWKTSDGNRDWQMNALVLQDQIELFIDAWFFSCSQGVRLLICFEDIHWFDCQAARLMSKLIREQSEIFWLATSRFSLQKIQALHDSKEPGWACDYQLSALGPLDIENILRLQYPSTRISSEVVEDIRRTTFGNALFIKHWITEAISNSRYKLAAGWLVKTTEGAQYSHVLQEPPISLHFLLQSQFDRLNDRQRRLAHLLSVLNHPYGVDQLLNFFHDSSITRSIVDECVNLHILRLCGSEDDLSLEFNHALMRDVAYSSLSLSQRMQWHTAIAQAMDSGRLSRSDPLIGSWHWMKSDQLEIAIPKAIEAGRYALATHSITPAIHFLTFAHQKMQHQSLAYDTNTVSQISISLAFAQSELGKHHTDRALLLSTTQQYYASNPQNFQRIRMLMRHIKNCVIWRFMKPKLEATQSELWTTLAVAQLLLAEIAYFQGSIREMQWHALCVLDASERCFSAREQSATYGGISLVCARFGLNWLSNQYAAAALRASRRTADKVNEVDALLYLCLRGVAMADWSRTSWRLERAFQRNARVGHARRRNELLIIQGYFFEFKGDYKAAIERYRECWRLGVQRNDHQTTAWGQLGCSRIHAQQGQWNDVKIVIDDIKEDIGFDKMSKIELTAQKMLLAIRAENSAELMQLLFIWPQEDLDGFAQTSFASQGFLLIYFLSTIWLLEVTADDSKKTQLLTAMQAAQRAVKLHAKQFPVSRPIAHAAQALCCQIAGQPRRAVECIERSRITALQLGMPNDAKRAEELGKCMTQQLQMSEDFGYIACVANRLHRLKNAYQNRGK